MEKNKIVRDFYYSTKQFFYGLRAFWKEIRKPRAHVKGEEFEKFLQKKIFVRSEYDLVAKTHDYHENSQDYVESSLYPDFQFREKLSNEEFWVEAKYREKSFQGKIEWCKDYQLQRYNKLLHSNISVIIAIGFGGRPENPKRLFLVPLEVAKYSTLYLNFLKDYEYTLKNKNIVGNILDKVYDYK